MAQSTENLTVWDSIELDIFERMRAVRQPTYNFTVREVVGWMADEFPYGGQMPCVGIVIGDEECDDTSGVLMRRCKREVGIEMWVPVKRSKRKDIPHWSRIYQMIIADIEQTLYVEHSSGNPGHTRQGYAEDTEIITRRPVTSGDKTEVGAFVSLQVIYRHQVGDLYTAH
jgi:hypothetical protein